MAPIVIDGAIRIRVIWTYSGAFYRENVLTALIPSSQTVDQTTAVNLATLFDTAHTTSGLNAQQPPGIALDSVGVRDVRVANRPEFTAPVNSAGTGTGDLLAKGTALVVTLRTALAGRSFRGRVYVPGYSEAANDGNGRANAAASSAATAFIANVISGLSGQGMTLAVGSVKLHQANPVTANVVRDLIWDRQWRSARR